MIIVKNKYAIITREKPIDFITPDYDYTSYIEDALLNDSEEIANKCLQDLDTPNEHEVLHIKMTYEF